MEYMEKLFLKIGFGIIVFGVVALILVENFWR